MGSETFDEKNRKGIVMFSGAGQYGCDSTVLVNVSFYPIPVGYVETVICWVKSIMILRFFV